MFSFRVSTLRADTRYDIERQRRRIFARDLSASVKEWRERNLQREKSLPDKADSQDSPPLIAKSDINPTRCPGNA